MLQVSQLNIYPVKSLGGISKQAVQLCNTGFEYDRRWMLVDENNVFLSQRTHPQMVLLHTAQTDEGFIVSKYNDENLSIIIPYVTEAKKKLKVAVWEDICDAVEVSDEHNEWFSDMLHFKCKLVYMPDDAVRLVDKRYAGNKEITSFSDGYPILMIGEATLEYLNNKLKDALPMNRFRPNLVFTGGHAHIEDEMEKFSINEINFLGVKPCSRCVMTTINQQNAEKGKEPLKTLSTYRMKDNKIYFGQNVLHHQSGIINVGDTIHITQQGMPLF
jgi:uncharacterized protein